MLETMPFPEARKGSEARGESADAVLVGRLMEALGEAAHFVDAFEFTPTAPAPPGAAGALGGVPAEAGAPPGGGGGARRAPGGDRPPAARPPPPPGVLHLPRAAAGVA